MRKHTRLYAIVLTAFMLVGIMAAAATATIERSITGLTSISIPANGSDSVSLTLVSEVTGPDFGAEASAITVNVSPTGFVTAQGDKTTGGAVTMVQSGTDTQQDQVNITLTGQAQGNAVVTVTWQGQTHTINVTLTAPVIIPSPELSTTDPSALTWGGTWSDFIVSDANATPGTWTIAPESYDILTTKAHLAIDSDDSRVTFSLAQPSWKPTSADLDALWVACGNTGSWKGQDITGKVRVTKVRDADRSDSEVYTFTFKGKTLTLSTNGFNNTSKTTDVFKWSKDITADASTVKVTATGPGAISWDVGTLPDGLSVTSTDANANGESVLIFYGKPTKTYKDFEVKVTASNTGSSTGGVSDTYKFTIATTTDKFYLRYAPTYETPIDNLVADLDTVMPSSDRDVGDYIDGTASTKSDTADDMQTVILRAYPGPITWDYSDLEDMGLTVKVSDDTEFLVISGKYSEPTAANTANDRKYTVKATNQYTTTATETYTGDVMIWTVPTFDNSYIFEDPSGTTKESKKSSAYKIWKSDYFNTNSDLEQEIPVSNIPDATSWDVKISDATTAEEPLTVLSYDATYITDEFFVTDKSGNESKSYLSAKVKDGKLYLTGSADRVPSGGKITVTVTAQNHAGATSKPYSLKVVGTTPKLGKKNDMTLSGYGVDNSADIAIEAGDPTITMTAKIEAKTAKKIFGIEKDIDLLVDGPKYGIYIESSDMANGNLKLFMPASVDQEVEALAGLDYYGYKGYAFKKLPIVVTATNPDIKYDAKGKEITDKKIATQKATLSTSNKDDVPYWVAPEAEYLYELGLTTASYSEDLGKKQTIYVPQKEAFPTDGNPYYFELEGHGPFDVVVKPTDKNGIKAAVTNEVYVDDDDNAYSRPRVTFTGTPSGATKDVATAFSLTAKNPSTGKSAKLSVNFTALPKPAVQAAAIGNTKEKPATVGKKVKVAPKITSNSKKIGWKIDTVEWNSYDPEDGSGSVSQDLYNIWGLALDKKGKGSIEGQAKAATGTTTPLKVTMHAYTKASDESEEELTTSDTVTATIYIVGEKPKLATKKVTVTINEDGSYKFDDSVFAIKKLDNAKADTAADGDNPEITALGENKNRNHYVADMEPTETFSATAQAENTIAGNFNGDSKVVAAKGLSIKAYTPETASDAKYNTFQLDGTPTGATKKETVQIAMNNWGTIQTDKLTVTIVGQTPVVTASTESLTDLPETSTSTQKVTFTVSNADKVGSKIKWKITSKPSSGVKAKLVTDKSKPEQATVEITTKKATAGAETAVKVSATDSDTKKAGDKEVKLTVKAAADTTTEDTPTVVDDTKAVEETQTNEKALGEGEVHFGRERTAAGLTAAQRKFLADNGYVIAAVLPEIEVTEAGGQYALEVDELEEAAATGAELVYFAFSNKPTDDDEIVTFADLETGEETTVLPASRKLIVEPWFNVGTKYAPVIAVKAAAGEAEAATEEDVKAKAEEKAEEAAAEGTEAAPEVELKEVKDKDAE